MNSVPNEILSQIFQACFRNQRTERFGCARPGRNEAPLLLLHVCRRWHDCALSSPSLWSQLSIGRDKNRLKSVIAAKGWLDRAAQVPLSLDLWCGRPDPEQSTQNATDAALANIFTPSRIWKAVSLEAHSDSTPNPRVEAILDTVLTHAPVLESFAFSLSGAANPGFMIYPPRTIEIGFTPCLSSFSVRKRHLMYVFHLSFSSAHAYGNIRDLTLEWPMSINQYLHILGQCPNVEVLHVSFRGEIQPSPPIALVLKKLHSLEVIAVDAGVADFGDFFRALTTPALEQLSIEKYDFLAHSPPSNWPPLAQLLKRSQPPLKSLTLIGPCMIEDDIISCLQRTQELRVLSGDGHLFSSKVMEALTPSVDPPKILLCPFLTKIGLQGKPADFPVVGFSAVTAMIYRRWRHSKHGPINDAVKLRIRIEIPSEYCSRFLNSQRMAACLEEGMGLRL
ncbi:hypothetical protein BD410DRAFT_788629, partial [Rickenella mellea]